MKIYLENILYPKKLKIEFHRRNSIERKWLLMNIFMHSKCLQIVFYDNYRNNKC